MAFTVPVPLAPEHDVELFASDVAPLDDWLKRRALRNEVEDASRTFVICEGSRVIGYYSLAAGSVSRNMVTAKIRRNMPDPVPVVLLGRLAVDRDWQGKRFGGALLQDAFLRVVGVAQIIGIKALLVHAISEEAKTFYTHYGFMASSVEPMTLMLTLAEARFMLERNMS